MPYFTKNKCVYNKSTKKKVGCTEGSLKKYLAALHANVADSVNESMSFKDVVMSDDKSKAIVSYTLDNDPGTEISLNFNLLSTGTDTGLEADYSFGMIKDSKGSVNRFEDPIKAKKVLRQYGIKPDDIERRGQESYEILEDELRRANSNDGVNMESLTFNSLYNTLMEL